jgi:hypothetical protein
LGGEERADVIVGWGGVAVLRVGAVAEVRPESCVSFVLWSLREGGDGGLERVTIIRVESKNR